MATIRKRGSSWQVIIDRKGVYMSATFPTKAAASAWATEQEALILAGVRGDHSDKTFKDAIDKYEKEISPKKAGHRWEVIRLETFRKDATIAHKRFSEIGKGDIAMWRNNRLASVSGASVRREWSLLSNVFTVAINEWGWIKEHPMKTVAMPDKSKPRDRRVSQKEIADIQFALGYVGGMAKTKSHVVALAFEFACETALRAQEICNIERDDIVGNTVAIRKSKTHAGVRVAPLTPRAVEILGLLPDLFNITTHTLDALFRKAKGKLGITDLHFHDSRHEGITRLAQKLPILDLARSIGHQDLRMLMVYYNPTAEELADKLK